MQSTTGPFARNRQTNKQTNKNRAPPCQWHYTVFLWIMPQHCADVGWGCRVGGEGGGGGKGCSLRPGRAEAINQTNGITQTGEGSVPTDKMLSHIQQSHTRCVINCNKLPPFPLPVGPHPSSPTPPPPSPRFTALTSAPHAPSSRACARRALRHPFARTHTHALTQARARRPATLHKCFNVAYCGARSP